ncbi:MAG TPA: hypothetical protein VGI93_09210, partial [Steroidobacteraceae bacterium]
RLDACERRTDEGCCSRTAKSCGPDASTPASSQRRFGRPDRAQTNLNPLATVTRKPDHRLLNAHIFVADFGKG